MKRYISVILLLFVCLCADAQKLTILHVNDTHSHVDPERSGANKGMGGVIEQAAYIDSVRNAVGKKNLLLMHAGDFSQGSSYFTEMNGDVEVAAMNAAGYDVVCIGNHEFDNGIDELARRIGNLKAQVVCANYDFSGSPLQKLIKPYAVFRKAGRKIGVIGLLTDITPVVDRKIADFLDYKDPVEVAESYARYLKEEKGCDLVICLTHLGYDMKPVSDLDVAARTRNVDLVVGGHSHTRLSDETYVTNLSSRKVPVVSAWKWGLQMGNMTVDFQNQ